MKDEDLITFGKHKGIAMANVPAVWLISFHEEIDSKKKTKLTNEEIEVFNYISKTGIELLRKEALNDR